MYIINRYFIHKKYVIKFHQHCHYINGGTYVAGIIIAGRLTKSINNRYESLKINVVQKTQVK